MYKFKTILGPYPPPYRGVELQAKLEFEQLPAKKALFIGTSELPLEKDNIILVKRGSFFKNGPQLFLKIMQHRKEIYEIRSHYATTFGFLAALSKLFFNIQYTVTCHGSDLLMNVHNPFYNFFNKIALKNADKIFVVSRELGAVLIEHGYNHEKIVYRPNKIDKTIFKKTHAKKKNQILAAGAIQYSKGTDILIDAFEKVSKHFPNYKLIIAGRITGKNFYDKIAAFVKQKKLNQKIIFVGEKTPIELAKLMNESKLFVMPSRTEGYGMALAEALSCGLKAVSTNVGGLKEAGKSKNCIFVNPDTNELAAAIEKQLSRA